jgi:diguanylate cyclase (GGDEF)-like protein/PAS domain S-box-containing protein
MLAFMTRPPVSAFHAPPADARLHLVLAGLSGPALQTDAAGEVVFANDAFLAATGWARGEVVGAEWADGFVPAGCASRALFAAALRAGAGPARGEGEVFTRGGGRRLIAWDVVPAAGGPGGWVAVGRDVTEARRGAREQARLARALAESADRDALTGLLNARGFARLAEHAARVAARVQRTDAVLWVGLDDLAEALAAHGAPALDDAVCAAAEALRGVVRDSDVLARVAADAFAVYAVGTPTAGHGAGAAARVRAALDAENARARAAGRTFDLRCTVRAAERAPGEEVAPLLRRASAAAPSVAPGWTEAATGHDDSAAWDGGREAWPGAD